MGWLAASRSTLLPKGCRSVQAAMDETDEGVKPTDPFTPEGRAAMRAYLQRAEVRLSTMHRIATGFLGGAGLLFLLPVLLRDAVVRLVTTIYILPDTTDEVLNYLLLASTLSLPLLSLYLLIEDIITFYFTAYHAGLKDKFFHPRFVLSGVSFSEDECSEAKRAVIASQQTRDMLSFVVPQHADDREYYRGILRDTEWSIVPAGRVKHIPIHTDDVYDEVMLFDTALGLAGVVDRDLVEEVAKMEMSLVKHAIALRHLVLRYSKALLLFLFTTLVLTVSVELQHLPPSDATMSVATGRQHALMLYITFILLSFFTPFVVKRPIAWIYRFAANTLIPLQSDRELRRFEVRVIVLSVATHAAATIGFVLLLRRMYGDSVYIYAPLLLLSVGNIALWIRNWIKGRTTGRQPSRDEIGSVASPARPVESHRTEGTSVPQARSWTSRDAMSALHTRLRDTYSEGELRDLCLQFNIDYEDLEGYGKSERVRDLILKLVRRGMIPDLIEIVRTERPRTDWPNS
jgi:hypothetical protein